MALKIHVQVKRISLGASMPLKTETTTRFGAKNAVENRR